MKKQLLKTILITTLTLLSWSYILKVQAQALDVTFDTDGKVTTPICSKDDLFNSIVVQSDGKIVAVGRGLGVGGTQKFMVVARYNTDGSLDNTFGTSGIVSTYIGTVWAEATAVAIQADGKIVVGGFAYVNVSGISTYDFAALRYNTGGTLDSTFDFDGKATAKISTGEDDFARAIVIQPDGKIVLGGSAGNSTSKQFGLARFNTNGSLDNTFGNSGALVSYMGTGLSSEINSLALQTDGKLVAGGTYNDNFGFALTRFNANGTHDNNFGTTGNGSVITDVYGAGGDIGKGLAIQPDGKILFVGESNNGSKLSDFALLRYNTNGTLDNSFGTNGIDTTDFFGDSDKPTSLVVQLDGKIIVVGYTHNGGVSTSYQNFALARYLTSGVLDITFGSNGRLYSQFGGYTNIINSVALQTDGKIVVVGYTKYGSYADCILARYDPSIPSGALGGIDLITSQNLILIYPSPAQNQFTIESTNYKNTTAEIFNIEGSLLQSTFLQSAKTTLNIENLPAGIYFVKVKNAEGVTVKKIVKE